MEMYGIENLSLREIKVLRKSLDFIQITGIDAPFIAMLQHKLNEEVKQIEVHESNKLQEEDQKQKALAETIKQTKASKGKS